MFEHNVVLKSNELFLVGGSGPESGLYLRDTRFLSGWQATLNNQPLEAMSVRSDHTNTASITWIHEPHPRIDFPSGSVAIEQRIELTDKVACTYVVTNYHSESLDATLAVHISADFADMFNVRGIVADRSVSVQPGHVSDQILTLSGRGRDDRELTTRINWNQMPSSRTVLQHGGGLIGFPVLLQPQRSTTLEFTIELVDGSPVSANAEEDPVFAFWSGDPDLQQLVDQSERDLLMVQTTIAGGVMPAAGIPWYVAAFGRDSLIVALQTMHVHPDRVADTLRVLAAHQGEKVDPFTEEQPGKILHELRSGELARIGAIPHTPYYGSIDSTPLFVMTFAQHWLWHRDDQLWNDLIDHVHRALNWITEFGDVNGDGLIEFAGTEVAATHISQQGWKDASDSLNHPDATPVIGPVALVEVQGYVYAAYAQLSLAARLRGDVKWADELQLKAQRVQQIIEDQFWMEDERWYAQALDGAGQQVRSVSSNPGHLLFCGVPSETRANLMAERMLEPDMFAGWGVRTLSSGMSTYNPMSYHNGSIWPHDCSLMMQGLRDYGCIEAATELAIGLVATSRFDPLHRLSELYCGFARDDSADLGPVAYPTSCSPQAWAAASAHLVVRTLLGLRVDFERKVVQLEPSLPEQVDAISVANLSAFGELYGLGLSAHDDHYHIHAEGQIAIEYPEVDHD